MNVYRIGHAGLVVEAGDLRCLMDPVLVEPFECGMNRFEPPFEIDWRGVEGAYNAIVISHEHMDHFCLRTLHRLNRACLVLFPLGCGLIEWALTTMGFRKLVRVTPGQVVPYKGAELTFTPSNVNFPEVGVLFSHRGEHFWNCVDTEIGERAQALVHARTGTLDLMFAQYQALIEEELGHDGLGGPFPYDVYEQRVGAVVAARPRCVVPSSCGYRYASQPWLNHRGFPVTEREFLDDVRGVVPGILGVVVPPGGAVDTRDFVVREDALPFVRRTRPAEPAAVEWRPDRGVPALEDEDPYGHGADALRAALDPYLAGPFLGELCHPALSRWRTRLAEGGVTWRLEVVYPDGSVEPRSLDFARSPLQWINGAPRRSKMITSICASTLFGLRVGEITPYRALFTRRVVLKLYVPTRWGLQRVGSLADEPIARVLFPSAARRYVEAELRRLGLRPAPPEA